MTTPEQYEQERRAREQANLAKTKTEKTSNITKQIAIWASAVIALGLIVWGLIFLVSHYEPSTPGSLTIENVIRADDWVLGNKAAKVVLYEYADFQCPACAYYSPVLNQLPKDFGDKVALVFRYFPLPMHSNAIPMAHAVEAAGKQGKFWPMHDLAFTEQNKWESQKDIRATVVGYAKSLGLDATKFEKDFDSSEVDTRVTRDLDEATRLNMPGTPTFFLNGKQIQVKSYDELKTLLETAINENS